MKMPPHIEKELRIKWLQRGLSELEIIALMEFLCELADIQTAIVKQKGFIFQDKKAA